MTQPDRGASSIEYGLLIAAIAAVLVLAIVTLGDSTTTKLDETCTAVATETGSDCP